MWISTWLPWWRYDSWAVLCACFVWISTWFVDLYFPIVRGAVTILATGFLLYEGIGLARPWLDCHIWKIINTFSKSSVSASSSAMSCSLFSECCSGHTVTWPSFGRSCDRDYTNYCWLKWPRWFLDNTPTSSKDLELLFFYEKHTDVWLDFVYKKYKDSSFGNVIK